MNKCNKGIVKLIDKPLFTMFLVTCDVVKMRIYAF